MCGMCTPPFLGAGFTPPGLDCALLSPRRIAMTLSMHQASVPVSNASFHCTTACATLRQSGAEFGKANFMEQGSLSREEK